MRTLLVVAGAALVLASAATAKLDLSLHLTSAHPKVRQPVRVLLRSEEPTRGDCVMRVIAVAPGASASGTLNAFILGSEGAERVRGFMLDLRRVGPHRFVATLRFPSAGPWRLVVPNECAPGEMYPWPAVRSVAVR